MLNGTRASQMQKLITILIGFCLHVVLLSSAFRPLFRGQSIGKVHRVHDEQLGEMHRLQLIYGMDCPALSTDSIAGIFALNYISIFIITRLIPLKVVGSLLARGHNYAKPCGSLKVVLLEKIGLIDGHLCRSRRQDSPIYLM